MTLQTSMDTPKIDEEQPVARVDREIDRWQAAPLLPGTSVPAAGPLPTVRIYQPARSVMQSGPGRRHWVLEFQSRERPRVDPLMGWFGGGEPVSQLRLEFPDAQSAVTFAERHGWRYEFEVSPPRRIPPKSYTERFKYELADALRWVESWKGPAVNDRTREEIIRLARRNDAKDTAASTDQGSEAAGAALDPVEEASRQSFPDSDPPAWTGEPRRVRRRLVGLSQAAMAAGSS